ncbi:D-alanine--D-alanine ligase [soil metagenome]
MTALPGAPAALRIVVLKGGDSSEREVSLNSASQVEQALAESGHQVTALDVRDRTLPGLVTTHPAVAEADVIFPVLHGGAGEDGTVQALLALAGLPFVGSERLGCALSMDKEISKRLFRDAGVPTPDWIVERASGAEGQPAAVPASVLDDVEARLGLPVIVKPPSGGSTVGLTLAHDRAELVAAVPLSAQQEPRILFERYVKGRELTVGVIGGGDAGEPLEALPVGEIRPTRELFDYECKYVPGMAEEIFPADLDPAVAQNVQQLALKVHGLLRLRHLSRVDFLMDEQGGLWCLEANALPGMTANSLLPRAARARGWSFAELCDRLVRMAAGTPPDPTG